MKKTLNETREGRTGRALAQERGFTLLETLIAMIILVVGIVAVANLLLVASASNSVANRGTAAATLASQQLEQLARMPFNNLVEGGDLDTPCGGGNSFCVQQDLDGVGRIETKWQVTRVGDLMYIRVRSEGAEGTPMAHLTRAEFTTFRASNALPAAAGGSPTP